MKENQGSFNMHLLPFTNLVNQWHTDHCLTSPTNPFPAFHHYFSHYFGTLLFHNYFSTYSFHEGDEPVCVSATSSFIYPLKELSACPGLLSWAPVYPLGTGPLHLCPQKNLPATAQADTNTAQVLLCLQRKWQILHSMKKTGVFTSAKLLKIQFSFIVI